MLLSVRFRTIGLQTPTLTGFANLIESFRGLKSNGTETYAKAPYFQMASDSLSIL